MASQSQNGGDAQERTATNAEPSAAWTVNDCGSPEYLDGIQSQYDVRTASGRPVAYCFTAEEARLIAAAPDLYEALEAVLSRYPDGYYTPAIGKARAALAKAGGR